MDLTMQLQKKSSQKSRTVWFKAESHNNGQDALYFITISALPN